MSNSRGFALLPPAPPRARMLPGMHCTCPGDSGAHLHVLYVSWRRWRADLYTYFRSLGSCGKLKFMYFTCPGGSGELICMYSTCPGGSVKLICAYFTCPGGSGRLTCSCFTCPGGSGRLMCTYFTCSEALGGSNIRILRGSEASRI